MLTILMSASKELPTMIKEFIKIPEVSVTIPEKQLKLVDLVLTNSPEFFDKFSEHLKTILKDGKIDISDLPTFILMLVDFINSDLKSFKKLKMTRGDVLDLIETVLSLLISQDVIQTGDQKEKYLVLLKSSIKLLDSKVKLSKKLGLFF